MATQGLLFSEPSIAETCVWCELSEGIDPSKWAMLCRYVGTLSRDEFERIRTEIMPSPAGIKSALKRMRRQTDDLPGVPLVSIGPSGIGGQYQMERV